jgi:hypothetical protein
LNNSIKRFKTSTFYALGMALFICLSFSISAQAQRPEKAFGIGFQAGNPSGLALQFFRDHGVSTDILLAYNLEDFLFLNMHALWQTHLDQKNMTHLFYGPGGFIGLRDVDNSENNFDEFEAGISGNVGLNLIVKRVEFFGQVTPRFTLIPSTQFNWGGGVGIRFYI